MFFALVPVVLELPAHLVDREPQALMPDSCLGIREGSPRVGSRSAS
ncbi:hypothetical protein [Nonomuraea recticatena]